MGRWTDLALGIVTVWQSLLLGYVHLFLVEVWHNFCGSQISLILILSINLLLL